MNIRPPHKAKTVFAFLIAGLLAWTVLGQGTTPDESSPTRSQNYRIGPGDVIDIVVGQSPTLSRIGVRVNNEGRIQLPMIEEDVLVACSTERELSDMIREKYKKFVINPDVIVAVKEVNSNPVAVIGAVAAPGRFQLQRPVKILELLTLVNGTSEKAGGNIEIIRNRSQPYCDGPELIAAKDVGDELISINLADTLKGIEEANPYARAGDIIRVGESDQPARAYVMGSVKTPTAVDLSEPVTLTQAIAMSGGFASGAQSDKIVIRRTIEGSLNRAEMIVNLREINQRKRDDVLLRANDIIEVAGPGKLSAFFRTFIPSLTQIPFRVIP